MNLLTKTGLLPALHDKHEYHKQPQITVSFDSIVLPAPFGFRPFSQYYNPYSNGCSILCNHPIDQDTKETIKKAKEILERKCVTIQRNDIPIDDDVDDVFLPEVLFRRYTETDSRPQTPTPTITSITSRISHPRRCITPDPINEPEKMQLVLDLRRSLSQNAMSGNEGHVLSGVALSTPITSKLSTNVKSKMFDNDQSLVNLDTMKRKRKSEAKEPKPDTILKTNTTNVRQNVKQLKQDETLTQKKKKKKPKTKTAKRDTDKEFKDLAEPKETQVSSYDDSQLVEGQLGDEIAPSKEDENKENLPQDPYVIDADLLKLLQRELDLETVDNESDPQKRMVYEEVYAKSITNRRSSAVNDEIKSLRRELRLNSLITNAESLFTLPRTFTRRSARFELPMSKNSLTEMTSLDYLKLHVYITNNTHLVYNEVFKLHIDSELTETRLLPTSKIITALGQVMGRDFNEQEQQEAFELINLQEKLHIDFRTWSGICAMCERIFATKFAQKYLSKEEDPCHEIELVDFSLLDKKLENINVDVRLERMLRKIRDT